ncbi:MAG TPA: hypothetical protein VFJ80_07470 [Candidatus Limnocylindrales bacterium]|jgi:Tol biopolymer transport system component|nr:hypothetical protein [Candidatus Limnocylindrales bacterium]
MTLRVPLQDAELTRALSVGQAVMAPTGVIASIAQEVRATPQQRHLVVRLPRPLAPTYPDQPNRWITLLAAAALIAALVVGVLIAGRLPDRTLPTGNGPVDLNFRGSILRLPADGSDPRLRPFPGLDWGSGAWSPDGATQAFWGIKDGTARLVLVSSDDVVQMTIDPARLLSLDTGLVPFGVAWSPDGRSLLFDGSVRGLTRMFRYDLADGRIRDLTPGTVYGGAPAWSVDGLIAFTPTDQVAWGRTPWIMTADGQDAHPLGSPLPDGYFAGAAVWSPDGSRLLFDTTQPGARLYTVARDGTLLTRIAPSVLAPSAASWSPDGRHLMFIDAVGLPNDVFDTYTAESDGSDVRLVMRDSQPLGFSPDGTGMIVASPACDAFMRQANQCDQGVIWVDATTGASHELISAGHLNGYGPPDVHDGIGWSAWRAVRR